MGTRQYMLKSRQHLRFHGSYDQALRPTSQPSIPVRRVWIGITFGSPTMTHYSDIVSDISSGSIYNMLYKYILTFYLAFFLAFLASILAFHLASFLAFILACVRVQAWPTASGARNLGSIAAHMTRWRREERKKQGRKERRSCTFVKI